MIETLTIENLGVIADARLELSRGLTALTGETGAGKTMALTSLQLILGSKPDPAHVRAGTKGARVEGTFLVPENSPVLAAIDDVGGAYDVEGGQATIVVARHVPASGRSSAFIGGRRVPTAVLRSIAQSLVTVHGQSDQLRLATAAQQRQALDAFGGERVAKAARQWDQAYSAHAKAEERLRSFNENERENARRRLAYQALVAKVDEVSPQPHEDESLKAEASRLENTEARFSGLSEAAAQLSGSDAVEAPALAGIDAAIRALDGVGEAEDLLARLRLARDELGDIAATVASAAADTEADPARLAEIYARRQDLSGLRRELGMDNDEAIDAAAEARTALADLDDPEGTRKRLEEELERAGEDLAVAGAALHKARSKAAGELGALVGEELGELALANARFDIAVTPGAPAAHGSDVVEFLLASHPGAPLRPIGTSASGGELSRVMLAVEVSLAGRVAQSDHTFLFDEVDAGVGGRAAQAVGRRLAKLAAGHQVIVVTHLAQVAANAQTQAVVVKDEDDSGAKTDVVVVTGKERLEELARMLSGSDTDAARAHAAELLADSPNVAR